MMAYLVAYVLFDVEEEEARLADQVAFEIVVINARLADRRIYSTPC
jgi:hypothetical protein